MREIKFRVFNPSSKKFDHWGFDVDQILGFSGVTTGNGLTLGYAKANSEQYTGLKDKNGVEIYEGDIVNTYDYNDNVNDDKEEVWFCDGCWVVGFKNLNGFSILYDSLPVKVIGNIHENPELLKD